MAAKRVTENDGRVWVKINHKGVRTKRFIGRGVEAEREGDKLAVELNRDMKREGFVVKKRAEMQTVRQIGINLFATPKHRSRNTMENYKQVAENHIYPIFGAKAVSDVTAADIVTTLEQWRVEEYAPRTIKLHLTVLSLLLNTAIREKLIERNPINDLEPGYKKMLRGKTHAKVTKALNPEQLTLVLAALRLYNPERWWSAFFLLLARTGLRVGEALTLKWTDVDFQRRQLTIERTARRSQTDRSGARPGAKAETVTKQHAAPGETKTRQVRKVDMPDTLVAALQALANQNKKSAADAWVFPATQRSEAFHMSYTAIRDGLNKAIKNLKVGVKVTPHGFRHAYASQMLQAGIPVTYISQQLGHASVAMTLDIYSHFLPSAGEHPVNILDQLAARTEAVAAGENPHPIRTQGKKTRKLELVKSSENK